MLIQKKNKQKFLNFILKEFYCGIVFCFFFLFYCTPWPVITSFASEVEKKSNSDSVLFLLAKIDEVNGSKDKDDSENPANGSSPSSNLCSSKPNGCALFVSITTTNGNIGGAAGADSICANDATTLNAPGLATGSTYKALLMTEDGTRNLSTNWVLYPNTSYYSLSNSNLRVGVTNANSELPATFENDINTSPIVVYGGIFKGPPWIPSTTNTCLSWTNGIGAPNYGNIAYSNSPTGYIDGSGLYGCDNILNLYCVER
jgi:hypothetical protein